ncbi:MAG: 3-oxoacyl-[acyl-carrier-protein] reductase [Rikenellaceae bacterium]|nr:3-oxoacyl-[acyl-carrier-protein] reductase [Rikenellaceae bacterium]
MKLLEGKVALVTGATRGIGRAIALKFAENGANVAFTYLSSVAAAESLVAEIEALGCRAVGYASNASDFAGAHAVVEQVVADFGQIDILVNNAGQTKDGLIMRMSEEQWDSIIDTNLKSAFNFTHAVVPLMARRRAGSIVNMSSVVGTNGNAGQSNYAASKAGLIGLTKSIAKELGGRNIRCNAIAPGFIVTDMTDKLSDDIKAKLVADISLGRMGTAEEIANVALFLASDMSSYISGEVIKVAGCMKG